MSFAAHFFCVARQSHTLLVSRRAVGPARGRGVYFWVPVWHVEGARSARWPLRDDAARAGEAKPFGVVAEV